MQVSDEVTSGPPGEPALTPRQVQMIFISLMTAMALAALDGTIVNTALLTIVNDLGGLKSYTWVGTSYLLCSTISTMLMGKLSDLFGRRRLYLVAMVIFLVGSGLCGLATSMMQLVVARGLQGIGGGGLISLTFAIIADLVSPRERGKYSSMFTSVFAVGGVIGPLVGGLIVQTASWRWIFWVNLPLGVVAFALAYKVMHVPFQRRDHSVDYGGAALLTLGVSALLLGVSWSPTEYGWSSPTSIGLIAGGVAVLIGFLLWERTAVDAIVPLHLFKIPMVRSMLIAAGTVSVFMYCANSFVPLFLQGVTGVTPTNSGLLMSPMVVGVLVSATVTGRMIQRTGHYRRYAVFGFVMTVPAAVGMALLGQGGVRMAVLLGSMVILGLGVGISNPISTIAIQNAVDTDDIGVASSLSMFIRSLIATIGLAIFGTLMASRLAGRIDPALLREPREIRKLPALEKAMALDALSDAIRIIFLCCVPLAVIGLIAVVVSKEIPLRTSARVGRSDGDAAADAPVLAH